MAKDKIPEAVQFRQISKFLQALKRKLQESQGKDQASFDQKKEKKRMKVIPYCEISLLRLIQQDKTGELEEKFKEITKYKDEISFNKLITIAKVNALNRLDIVALRNIWAHSLVENDKHYKTYLNLSKSKD